MNSLRFKVGELEPINCKNHPDFPFCVLVSQDSLIWWPLNRFKTFDEALEYGRGMEKFIKENQLVNLKSVLWTSKL